MRGQVNIIEVMAVLTIFLSSIIFLFYFYNSSVYSMTYDLKKQVDSLAPEVFYSDFVKRGYLNLSFIQQLSTYITEYENYLNYLKVNKIGFCVYPKVIRIRDMILDSNSQGIVIRDINSTCFSLKSNLLSDASISFAVVSNNPILNSTRYIIIEKKVPLTSRSKIYKVILKISPGEIVTVCNVFSDWVYIFNANSSIVVNNVSYPVCMHSGENPEDVKFSFFGNFGDPFTNILAIYKGIGK